MRFFTSDTHYGHQNIIGFCGRPYEHVDHMNVDLVNRAATPLKDSDELWHLGDVALGRLDDTLTHLARIAVEVTLVAGNHDRCHPYNGKRSERFVELYRERCGLADLVPTNTRLTLSNGEKVSVSHFPFADPALEGRETRHGDVIVDKFAPWRVIDDGSWLLCGHVHDSWRQKGRMVNVGVDAWGVARSAKPRSCSWLRPGRVTSTFFPGRGHERASDWRRRGLARQSHLGVEVRPGVRGRWDR